MLSAPRAIILVAALVFFPALLGASANWLEKPGDALKQAKEGGMYLLVDFKATWCQNCRKLEDEVFESKEFSGLTEGKVLLLSVDADREAKFVDQYKVDGFPTILLLDPEGKEIGRIAGYKPFTRYIKELEQLLSKIPAKG